MDLPTLPIAKPAVTSFNPLLFIRQSIAELKKVTWPTRKQTVKLTLVVISVSALVGLYIGALDYIFTLLMEYIL